MAIINLEFRIATPHDAQRIQQLVQSAFRTIDSREGWTGNEELASNFRLEVSEVLANIAKPDLVTMIAVNKNDEDGDALVATIEVAHRDNNRGGVGRQVLTYAEEYCRRTWGVEKFSLNALSTRKALIEWYMRRGYRKTGETSPFPREKFSNLALPEDLCFVELEKDASEVADVDMVAGC